MKIYESNAQEAKVKAERHNKYCLKGNYNVVYKFNENVLQGETDVKLSKGEISLKGYKNSINLKKK